MSWTQIEAAWHELTDQILAHWPDLHGDGLVAVAGDRSEFARYIAASYDLTEDEAAEVIETWIRRLNGQAAVSAAQAA